MVKKKKYKNDDTKEELTKPYMTIKKDNFLKIIKNPVMEVNNTFGEILIDAVTRTNKIVTHTYQFLKLFYLYLLEPTTFLIKPLSIPTLNVQLIRTIMNTITKKVEKTGSKPLSNALTRQIQYVYDNYYKQTIIPSDIISRDSLKYILNYEEKDIIKNISTNIKEHFASHLLFFIKVFFKFDKQIEKIKKQKLEDSEKKIELQKIYTEYNNVCKDVTNVKNDILISNKKHHNEIIWMKNTFIPSKKIFLKKSIFYDVKAKPLDYIFHMIVLNKKLEEINEIIIQNHLKNKKKGKPPIYKLFNALPLRTEIIPKYITLDTAGLIALFTKKNKAYNLKNLTKVKDSIWSKFFKIDKKSFRRNGYKFNHMIKTDGIGTSIVLIKVDKKGNPIAEPTKKELEEFELRSSTKYIDDIKISKLKSKPNIIPGDPGKNDLIKFTKKNPNGSGYISFAYTKKKRNYDTKKKRYDQIRSEQKEKLIKGKTISEIEKELSCHNHKTCDFISFRMYLSKKNEINRILFKHYSKEIYRKLKFNTYINTQRSEDNMVNDFKRIMGKPEDTIVVIGDYSDTGLKGTEPSITKKTRKIFKRHGFDVYLANEYNTSKLCCHCENETENFIKRKKKNSNKESLVWKLIRCKICKSIHNRDSNATKNMLKLIEARLNGKERPKKFMPRPCPWKIKEKPKEPPEKIYKNTKEKNRKKTKKEIIVEV
jgi:hypothetical protein